MFRQTKHKQSFILLHRYLGLTSALFLIVAAITGSILAFYHELDEWLNPELFLTQSYSGQDLNSEPRSFLKEAELYHIADRYSRQFGGNINTMTLEFVHGRALRFYVNDVKEFNRLFVDPYTGEILGQRQWGDLSQSWKNIAGFIYRLHYTLWMPDRWGVVILGLIGLLWTLNCFIGIATTLPVTKVFSLKLFFSRWKQSFRMRWKSQGYAFHFLLHRSAGLWLWALLFIFAWSAVAFNLPDVYKPVTNTLLTSPPANPNTGHQLPPLDLSEALSLSRQHAKAQAVLVNAELGHERSLRYLQATNTYQYRFNSSFDVDEKIARSVLYLDAHSGELLATFWPTGQYSSTTVTQWLYALHMAEVFGWPYRLLVFLFGIVVAYFSYSGVYIWWQKKRKMKKSIKYKHKTL